MNKEIDDAEICVVYDTWGWLNTDSQLVLHRGEMRIYYKRTDPLLPMDITKSEVVKDSLLDVYDMLIEHGLTSIWVIPTQVYTYGENHDP